MAIVALVLVAAMTGAAAASLPLLLVVFVAYHTALGWLAGATVGKAMVDLRLGRADGAPLGRGPGSLLLVLARSSVGYLLVDVFVVGWLVAVVTPARRPLHDLVFRTDVTWGGGQVTRAAARRRVDELADRHERAVEEVGRAHRRWRRLAGWLVTGVAFLDQVLSALRTLGGWLARRLGALPADASPAAGAGTSAATGAGTGAATGAGTGEATAAGTGTVAGAGSGGVAVLSGSVAVAVVAVTAVVSGLAWSALLGATGDDRGGDGAEVVADDTGEGADDTGAGATGVDAAAVGGETGVGGLDGTWATPDDSYVLRIATEGCGAPACPLVVDNFPLWGVFPGLVTRSDPTYAAQGDYAVDGIRFLPVDDGATFRAQVDTEDCRVAGRDGCAGPEGWPVCYTLLLERRGPDELAVYWNPEFEVSPGDTCPDPAPGPPLVILARTG